MKLQMNYKEREEVLENVYGITVKVCGPWKICSACI